MPPTDSRLGLYTFDELILEFLADAVENGQFKEGPQPGSIQSSYKLPDGTPVFRTGDPVVDALEEEFAREAMQEIQDERRRGIVRRHQSPAQDNPLASGLDYDLEEMLRGKF